MRHAVVTLALLASCARSVPPTPPAEDPSVKLQAEEGPTTLPPLYVEMLGHYIAARTARDALIQGDVESTRQILTAMGSRTVHPGIPMNLQMYASGLKAEAHEVVHARSAGEVANVLARTSVWCGRCHRAGGVRFELVPPTVPEGEDLRAHMQRHAWVAARLWDALVQPSTIAWAQAAKVLEEAPLNAEQIPHEDNRTEAITVMARKVHDLDLDAREVEDVWDRQEVLAQLWGTCADCHDDVRGDAE